MPIILNGADVSGAHPCPALLKNDFKPNDKKVMNHADLFCSPQTSMAAMLKNYSEYMEYALAIPIGNTRIKANERFYWETIYQKPMRDVALLGERGLYIFGYNSVPMYIGKTNNSFRKRFVRYFGASKVNKQASESGETMTPQFLIAKYYADELGTDMPDSWRLFEKKYPQAYEKIRKSHKGSPPVRIKHAQEFVQRTKAAAVRIEEIWVMVLPIGPMCDIAEMEKRLIATAVQYNEVQGHTHLLNTQHLNYRW